MKIISKQKKIKKKIILIGCGGHAKVCADLILNNNKYQMAGFVCTKKKNSNLQIIGTDKELKEIRKKYKYALIGVGQIKDSTIRRKIFKVVRGAYLAVAPLSSTFSSVRS